MDEQFDEREQHWREVYALQQREQNLRRDLEVVRKEKERLHARVGSQRRELGALSRCYWQVCQALSMRGRALSLLAPFVRVMGKVRADELLRTAELDGRWPSQLAAFELERRKHWHFVGEGLALTELPKVEANGWTLEQTG